MPIVTGATATPSARRPAPDDTPARAAALAALGADDATVAELLAYNNSPLGTAPLPALPLAAEPSAAVWAGYAAEADATGAAACLTRHLVQLRFPVAAGASEGAAYLAATRRGDESAAPAPDRAPAFADSARVHLFVHQTVVGPLPVVVAGARADFERLVRSLTRRNEPDVIAPAMGACMVAGYNNWGRVREERRRWAAARGADDEAGWRAAFAALVAERERYQDRFVLLSDGPYSGVAAAAFGLDDAAWRSRSLRIRLEHECAHYATKRLFGTMRNALHDELIADYLGMTAGDGRARAPYRAGWALRFFGLEGDAVRPDGRLHTYRGAPPLSDAAFAVLARAAARAAGAIEAYDRARPRAADPMRDGLDVLVALARTPVELLTTVDAPRRLLAAHAAARRELARAGLHPG